MFEAFGPIRSFDMVVEGLAGGGKHKGCGYVEYENPTVAEGASQAMNNFDLGGQLLKVCMAVSPPSLTPSRPTPVGKLTADNENNLAAAAAAAAAAVSAKLSSLAPKPTARANTSVNDENVTISGSNQRMLLMKKLSRKNEESPIILLTDMVSPEEVDDDLEEEVQEECEKFGKVNQVVIHTSNGNVRIFVEFKDVSSTQRAIEAMNGRWFAGHQIGADLYDEKCFHNGMLDK